MKKIIIFFFLPITWFFCSIILLTIPGSDLPKEDWLDKIWGDKLIHIGMFSIMVFLWCRALVKIKYPFEKLKSTFLVIAALAVVYGITMEFVQRYFIPGRSFEVMDMVADAIGASTGLIYCLIRYIKK